MSWFGSRSTANPGHLEQSSSHVNKQKHKQIESLRDQIPWVIEVKRDEQYSVTATVNGLTLILNIFLPARFPFVGPEVSISPSVQHPWVNNQMIVDGSPLMKNFTIHSKLGRAIDQVLREFEEHPPQLISSSSLPYPVGGTPQNSVPGGLTAEPFSPYTFSSVPQSTTVRVGAPESPEIHPRRPAPALSAGSNVHMRYKCPPVPENFEEISKMSTEELVKYLTEPEGNILVDDFVSQLDPIKMVQVDTERLFQDNEDLAAINLCHEPEIQDDWTQLQEKFLEMEALKEEHEKKLNEQRQLIDRYQERNVVAQMKTAVNEAETESEVYAEDFLEAKVPLSEFIQKYKQMRKLHHLRKTKYEKLVNH